MRYLIPIASFVLLAWTAPAQHWLDAPRDFTPFGSFKLFRDFDGDGDLDAIAVQSPYASQSQQVRGLVNDGQGNFSESPGFDTGALATLRMPAGDFNGDGRLDLAAATHYGSLGGPSLMMWPGLPGGGFGAPVTTPLSRDVLDLAAGDADGDGYEDLVILTRFPATAGASDFQLQWMAGSASGSFTAAPAIAIAPLPRASPIPEIANGIAVVDWNLDGSPDVVAMDPTGTSLGVITTSGLLLSLNPPYDLLPGAYAGGLTTCDVDGNGTLDVVAWAHSTGTTHLRSIRIVPGSGPVFGPAVSIPVAPPLPGGAAQATAVGLHVDQDGVLDLAFAHSPTAASNYVYVTWLAGQGGGAFLPGPTFPVGPVATTPLTAAVADTDGDGLFDLGIGRSLVYGTGAIESPFVASPPFGLNAVPFPWDVDDDGDLDLVAPDASATPNVLLSDAQGHMTPRTWSWPLPAGGGVFTSLRPIGDVDGNHRLDWIVPPQSGPSPSVWHLLSYDGAGAIVDLGPAAPAGSAPTGIPFDFDLDGDLDLAGSDIVWINQGSGFFTAVPGAAPYPGFTAVAAADFDADGDDDLVLVDHACPLSGSPLRIAWNIAGSLAVAPLPVFPQPQCFPPFGFVQVGRPAVADFDGDGDLDIVVDDSASNAGLNFLRNDGGGIFSANAILGGLPSWSPLEVFVEDVDGDGLQDVLTGGIDGAIHRRSGAGFAFDLPRRYFVPYFVSALRDMDGDGDKDLIGTRVIAKGRRIRGAAAGYARQYGTGSAGSAGHVPVLGAAGPFRVGLPANLRLRNALGGATAVLVLGAAESNHADFPLPGSSSYAEPWLGWIVLPLAGTPGIAGAGEFTLPAVTPPSFANLSLFFQFAHVDPGAPSGLAVTNGLEVHYGP